MGIIQIEVKESGDFMISVSNSTMPSSSIIEPTYDLNNDQKIDHKDKSLEKDHLKTKQEQQTKETEATAKEKLTPEQKQQINQLKQIERKVEAHEQAHKSVGGQFAGAMSFSYTKGPDGRRYKTGGEVSISVPSGDDPQKLIGQLMQVKRAALAPSDPSAQDIKVASMVQAKLQIARAKMREAYQSKNKSPQKIDQKV